jgi:GNAT superfamily N-acetyltransferase
VVAPAFQVRDLVDYPHFVPTISRWMWEEWDRSRGWTLEQSVEECRSWCRRDALPWGVVAVDGDRLLGVMCMHPRDLDEHPELTPWMACQYVAPDRRGRGVARTLGTALEQRARGMGFLRLYMWTEHNVAIYGRYGYRALFSGRWYGRNVTVLAKELK